MERPCDFVEGLDKDMSIKILLCFDNPWDLAAVSAVSKSWRRFVVENGLCKQLCLRLYPDVSKIVDVELIDKTERLTISTLGIPGLLERDHRVFSLLSCGLMSFPSDYQIRVAICASSTDRFPEERIDNTLELEYLDSDSTYWSSEGRSDPTIPETLVYELVADLCLIAEIHVQPLQASWEPGHPIYSAEAVRFCMGHRVSPLKSKKASASHSPSSAIYDDDMFRWTYTSP